MTTRYLLPALLLSALLCAGCVTTAAAPVAHVVMGAEGDYVILEQSVAYFESYSSLEIEPPVSGMGEGCPPEFLEAFEKGVTSELLKKPYFSRIDGADNPLSKKKDGQTLILRSAVVDYSVGRVLNRVSTFGRNTFVIVRVELVDKESGQIICRANVRGAIKSVAHREMLDLVHGVGRGLVKLFRDHHVPAG